MRFLEIIARIYRGVFTHSGPEADVYLASILRLGGVHETWGDSSALPTCLNVREEIEGKLGLSCGLSACSNHSNLNGWFSHACSSDISMPVNPRNRVLGGFVCLHQSGCCGRVTLRIPGVQVRTRYASALRDLFQTAETDCQRQLKTDPLTA